jgi:hypothetical protein
VDGPAKSSQIKSASVRGLSLRLQAPMAAAVNPTYQRIEARDGCEPISAGIIF